MTDIASIEIVDAHHHLWDCHNMKYDWLTSGQTKYAYMGDISDIVNRDYLVSDYRQDVQGFNIVKSVCIEAEHDPTVPDAEAKWMQQAADTEGLPTAIVARAPLNSPDIEGILDQLIAIANVRGVRHNVHWHQSREEFRMTDADHLNDPVWHDGFAKLANYDLSFDLNCFAHQFPEATRVIAANPDVPVIIDHLGNPIDRSSEGLDEWRAGLKKLADLSNVVIKLSGVGQAEGSWTYDVLKTLVLDAIEIFGVDRCMFASNFPVDRCYSGFAELYEAFHKTVEKFSGSEQQKLFSSNAERFYRI